MSLAFLAKKSWHTANLRNVEKVWLAEQKHAAEEKKLAELKKNIEEERQMQELRKLQAAHGSKSATVERLDWMYQGPMANTNERTTEEYLLGKEYKPNEAGSDAKKLEDSAYGALAMTKAAPPANDAFQRLNEDPMMMIRSQQKRAQEEILKNPVKMKKIKGEVEKLLKDKKAKKKSKKKEKKERKKEKKHKSRRDRSISVDSDASDRSESPPRRRERERSKSPRSYDRRDRARTHERRSRSPATRSPPRRRSRSRSRTRDRRGRSSDADRRSKQRRSRSPSSSRTRRPDEPRSSLRRRSGSDDSFGRKAPRSAGRSPSRYRGDSSKRRSSDSQRIRERDRSRSPRGTNSRSPTRYRHTRERSRSRDRSHRRSPAAGRRDGEKSRDRPTRNPVSDREVVVKKPDDGGKYGLIHQDGAIECKDVDRSTLGPNTKFLEKAREKKRMEEEELRRKLSKSLKRDEKPQSHEEMVKLAAKLAEDAKARDAYLAKKATEKREKLDEEEQQLRGDPHFLKQLQDDAYLKSDSSMEERLRRNSHYIQKRAGASNFLSKV